MRKVFYSVVFSCVLFGCAESQRDSETGVLESSELMDSELVNEISELEVNSDHGNVVEVNSEGENISLESPASDSPESDFAPSVVNPGVVVGSPESSNDVNESRLNQTESESSTINTDSNATAENAVNSTEENENSESAAAVSPNTTTDSRTTATEVEVIADSVSDSGSADAHLKPISSRLNVNNETSQPASNLIVTLDQLTINEDTVAQNIDVLANDYDNTGAQLAVTGFTQGANGGQVIQEANGLFQYIPPADYHGIDRFSYEVENSSGERASAEVQIDILAVNDLPVANSDNIIVTPLVSTKIDVLANDKGLGDGIVISLVSDASNGSVSIEGNRFVYQANDGAAGEDSFLYKITDTDGDISLATVNIGYQCEINCRVLALSWDPSVSEDIVGYNVYMGTEPGIFETSTFVGNVTEYEYFVEPKGKYYFAVSALNGENVESELSETANTFFW